MDTVKCMPRYGIVFSAQVKGSADLTISLSLSDRDIFRARHFLGLIISPEILANVLRIGNKLGPDI